MRTPLQTLESTGPALDPCTACSTEENDPAIDRRAVLGKGMLAAVAAVLGTSLVDAACAPAHGTQTAAMPMTSSASLGVWVLQVRAADFPTLATVGGIARVDGTSEKPVALVRVANGYAAFSLRCPHAGGVLDPQDGGFLCPRHGAKFSADGKWVGGHEAKDLHTLAVVIDDKTGVITISG